MSAVKAQALDPMSGVDIMIEDRRWLKSAPGIEAVAQRCHETAAARLRPLAGPATLLLADDARLQALNAQFRRIDRPTNVLSFPSGSSGGIAPESLGDLAMGFETCAREAEQSGLSLADHAAHLIVHGLLHLIGYDHQTDEDAAEMETLETEILAEIGIADPYQAALS